MGVPDSPLALSPYAVLGVDEDASSTELRRAYRRKLRETHPDTGGAAEEFGAVQRAWEQIGTAEARVAYDNGTQKAWNLDGAPRAWAPPAPSTRAGRSRPQSRAYGHPGGWYREQYLELLHEWVGRGVDIADPYDLALVRSAPRDIQHLLASAVAEEDTAVVLAGLGIGFTVWNDVRTDPVRRGSRPENGLTASPQGAEGKIDHILLGPSGLWAILSEDWGGTVSVRRGELVGPGIHADERPMHELADRARAFSRQARVRVHRPRDRGARRLEPGRSHDHGQHPRGADHAHPAFAPRRSGADRGAGGRGRGNGPVRAPNPGAGRSAFRLIPFAHTLDG